MIAMMIAMAGRTIHSQLGESAEKSREHRLQHPGFGVGAAGLIPDERRQSAGDDANLQRRERGHAEAPDDQQPNPDTQPPVAVHARAGWVEGGFVDAGRAERGERDDPDESHASHPDGERDQDPGDRGAQLHAPGWTPGTAASAIPG